jgi:hypothetical protein
VRKREEEEDFEKAITMAEAMAAIRVWESLSYL